jgi:uncharacterized repeat protein (TIGR02543 family)
VLLPERRNGEMKKRMVSLLCVLALCLGLLPTTALAAAIDAPQTLYVAGQVITDEGYYTQSGDSWTKSSDTSTPPSAPYFHYTKGGNNTPATLTLSGATIQGGTSTVSAPYGAGIYAQCKNRESVSLTIELIGNNTITGYYGIYMDAQQGDTLGANASLNITGDGSLTVTGTDFHGLFVKGGTGNASLNIEKATVTSNTNNSYAAGVYVMSSTSANTPTLSLTVNGGSLTASGGESSDGIQFNVGSPQATGAITSLTVTDHAIVDARNGGISASRISETLPTPTPTDENSSGIVFDGKNGTVYGDVTLQEDLEIDEGESLTIGDGASLTIPEGKTLTNNGVVTTEEGGTLTGNITNAPPKITTESLNEGTVNAAYNQTLAADNNPTSWSVTNGALPNGLTLENGTISGTPTAAGTSTFTVTATNDNGSDSKLLTLPVTALAEAGPDWTYDETAQTLTNNGDNTVILYNVTKNSDGSLSVGFNTPNPPGSETELYFTGDVLDLTGDILDVDGKKYTIADIKDDAFLSCPNLARVVLPEGLTTIGTTAFSCDVLREVTLPASVTSIGQCAFSSENLTGITVAEGNENYCSADGVLFSKDMTTLIQYPAAKSGSSYTVPNQVTTIGPYAFSGSKLTEVILPADVQAIYMCAFSDCTTLETVDLSGCEDLKNLDNSTFSGCAALKEVTLPAGLTGIWPGAFDGCEVLETVTLLSEEPPIVQGGPAALDFPRTTRILVPPGSVEAYKTASVWSGYADQILACGALDMSLSDSSLAMSEGSAPPVLVVTLTNSGSTDVTGLSASLTGSGASSFDLEALTGTTLGAGESTTFTVTPHAGLTVGTYQAEVRVTGESLPDPVIGAFTLTVNKPTTYTVTANANPAGGGTVTVNGSGTSATVTAGSEVTLTATANTGYRFTGWTSVGGGAFADASSPSTTFTMPAEDVTITANWQYDPPYIPPTKTPSEQALDKIEDAQPGDTVTISISGGNTKLDKEVFEALAEKDVILQVELPGGVSWTVNGKDIPENADLTDIDMGVSMNTSTIPVDLINMVTGEKGAVQMTLAHDGEFGFTMTLTAPLGTENKGLWANLYHYNEADRKMTFETAAKVSADGSVSLPFTHASAYAIVLDEKSHELPFTDTVKGAWYQEAVEYVYRKGIMNGVSATAFKPGATLSRAMVAQILYNLEGQPAAEGESTFTDVRGHWASSHIAWAQERGVLNGYEDNTFRPDRAVSREELAQMLYNYAKYKEYDLTAAGDLTVFPDGDDVSDWAEVAMEWANGMGLINGFEDGALLPGGTATRAQAAVMLMAFSMEIAK